MSADGSRAASSGSIGTSLRGFLVGGGAAPDDDDGWVVVVVVVVAVVSRDLLVEAGGGSMEGPASESSSKDSSASTGAGPIEGPASSSEEDSLSTTVEDILCGPELFFFFKLKNKFMDQLSTKIENFFQ